jgi:DNA-binding FadR family transcriptional regulator
MGIKAAVAGSAARARRKPLRIPATIAREIGMQIVSGALQPGDVLDGEIETSGRLRVSRTAYREAVRILAAKGLVKALRKVGTRVTPREEWHLLDPDVLGWIFAFEPDDETLASLFELRRMVEPEAAALAAARRNDEDLRQMAAALQGMAKHGLQSNSGRLADQAFHAAVLRASRNAFVVSLTASVGAAVTWTTFYKGTHSRELRDSLPDHQRVYDAIGRRDGRAARHAMTELVNLALRDTDDSRKRQSGGSNRKKRATG